MTEPEAHRLLSYLIKHEHLSRLKPPVTMSISNIQGAWAHYSKHRISVGKHWLNNYFNGLTTIIHEFSHIIARLKSKRGYIFKRIKPHGKEFVRTERRLLKGFGITAEYTKKNTGYVHKYYLHGERI